MRWRGAAIAAIALVVAAMTTPADAASTLPGTPLQAVPRSVPSNGEVWLPSPCSRTDTGVINVYLGIDWLSQIFGPVARGQLIPLYGQGHPPGAVIVGIECHDAGGAPDEYYLINPFRVTAPVARPPGIGRPAPPLRPLDAGRSRVEVLANASILAQGSMRGQEVNAEMVAIAGVPWPTSSDPGYWIAAADGGVFTYGSAQFVGSMGGRPLNAPIVDIAAARDGQGYWLLARDGGVFAFGAAPFLGSAASMHLRSPAVALLPTTSGHGYWVMLADGGVLTFGDAPFRGSAAGTHSAPISSACSNRLDDYFLLATDGTTYAYPPEAPLSVGPPRTPSFLASMGGVARGDVAVSLSCYVYYGGPGIVATINTASGASTNPNGGPGAAYVGGGRLLDISEGFRLVQR